jgi:hypothetical protein
MDPLYTGELASKIGEILKKISYKPGWKIKLVSSPVTDRLDVVCIYEGYESEHAAFEPVTFEPEQVSMARQRIAVSIGKTVRNRKPFAYHRSFSRWDFESMKPEDVIKHIIGGTIREAEMYEYERWFKFDGCRVFDEQPRERR